MKKTLLSVGMALLVVLSGSVGASVYSAETTVASPFAFSGSMSKQVMDNYLAKAVTIANLSYFDILADQKAEWLRFLRNTGTKLVSRAAFCWDDYTQLGGLIYSAERMANAVHAQDPECILEGCIFETTSPSVETISIPAWVFEEFELPVIVRNFDYEAMLFSDGRYIDHFGNGVSVPDVSKIETQMFQYYLACQYIDAGMEALHFGQTGLTGEADPFQCNLNHIFQRVRNYAKTHARRGTVLINSHQANLYDNGNPAWYSASSLNGLQYNRLEAANYYKNDTSGISCKNASSENSAIVYKLDDMSGFEIVSANSSKKGANPSAYELYTSADGLVWNDCAYTSVVVHQRLSLLPNYRMTNATDLPTGTRYLKVKWKQRSGGNDAVLLNVRLNGNGVLEDTLTEPSPGMKTLSLDYITYPMRAKGINDMPEEAFFEPNWLDSVYQKTPGGLNPQGFVCDNSSYLVELDNGGGNNGHPGEYSEYWIWGYDEITWFALQSDDFRRSWLNYAVDWLTVNDPNGFLVMPGSRGYLRKDGVWDVYNAIRTSSTYPTAFGDEETIREIFTRTGASIYDENQNGSFENGTNNWYLDSPFQLVSSETHSGKQALRLSGNNTNQNALYFLETAPNTNYRISLYAKCGTAASYFNVYSEDWSQSLIGGMRRFDASGEWVEYAADINSENNTKIIFAITDYFGAGYVNYYDDIRIVKTDNRLANGGFENGLYGWNQHGNVFSQTNAESSRDRGGLCLSGNGGGGRLYQSFTVLPNTDYVLNFDGKCGAPSSYAVMSGETEVVSGTVVVNNAWTSYKKVFNSGSRAILEFVLRDDYSGNYINYYDSVTLMPAKSLIINGGFENGSKPFVLRDSFNVSAEDKKSGSLALKVNGIGLNGKAYQRVYVKPNTDYVVKFSAKCNAPSNYGMFNGDWSGIIAEYQFFANNTWHDYSVSFNSGSNHAVLFTITDNCGTGYVSYFDDIVMY